MKCKEIPNKAESFLFLYKDNTKYDFLTSLLGAFWCDALAFIFTSLATEKCLIFFNFFGKTLLDIRRNVRK